MFLLFLFLLMLNDTVVGQTTHSHNDYPKIEVYAIDYKTGEPESKQNFSSLFIHLPNKLVQLLGNRINYATIYSLSDSISLDSLTYFSNKTLNQRLQKKHVFIKVLIKNKPVYYEVVRANTFILDGSKLYRMDSKEEKQLYIDFKGSLYNLNGMQKNVNGSININPSIAFGDSVYIRSKSKIGCLWLYEIMEHKGKHFTVKYWVPEIGIIQESESGYLDRKAALINSESPEKFIHDKCSSNN